MSDDGPGAGAGCSDGPGDTARPSEVTVVPPLAADPVFAQAVDEAILGDPVADSPEAQPQRKLSAAEDFSSLYIRHRTSFALHARRFLNDPRDIDEVVQETFLRLFLAMPELDNELQALAFGRRTLTNLCIDRYRAWKRRPTLIDLDEGSVYDVEDDASYDDPVLRAEDAAIVRQALALLSPLHRAALVKREIEEKPLPVIAAELDVPEESVKHLLHRARRALRRLLVGTSAEPGADLGNAEILRLANQRLARATMRGANVVLVLFVTAVTVVGGLRVSNDHEQAGSSGVSVPPQAAPVGGAARLAPATHPRAGGRVRSLPRRAASHLRPLRASSPPAAAPVTSKPPRHASAGPARRPTAGTAHRPTTAGAPSGPAPALQPGVFALNAPALGVAGRPAVRTTSIGRSPSGAWSSSSSFLAVTAAGPVIVQQAVQLSTDGVASANLTPSVPTSAGVASQLQESSVAMTVTPEGNRLLQARLTVSAPAPTADTATSLATVLVTAVYSRDLTQVLAETVVVNPAEGSAPCCSPAASSALPSQAAAAALSTPVQGAATPVSTISPDPTDDRTTSSSS